MIKTIVWDGKPITKPGVYTGISLDHYHRQKICDGACVSSTNLRRVLECNGGSPAHFYSEWTGNPNAVEAEQKDYQVIGRATHHLMLGEPNFAEHFAVRPKEFDSWRTNAAKQWKQRADAAVAQVEAQPKQNPETELDVIRVAGAQVRGDGAAHVAG